MEAGRLFAAVLLCFFVVACVPVCAAEPADCAGVVLDENGVLVRAAEVKLTDAAGHVYRTETDATGRFAFHHLSSGDYKAEVRKEGFFLLTGQTFTLHAGSNELSLLLNHEQEVRENVQVTAPSNQIDAKDTTQRSTLSARDIRDIPVPNTHVLQQSLVAMPEIVEDNRANLHVAGARSGETQYLMDGFEIGDPVSGAFTSRFNVDATRGVEVQSGNVSAAYPHSGASILSLETPDGDDRWRFGTTNPAPGINGQEACTWETGTRGSPFPDRSSAAAFGLPMPSAFSIPSGWWNNFLRTRTLSSGGRETICFGCNTTFPRSTSFTRRFSTIAQVTTIWAWTHSTHNRLPSPRISAEGLFR